MGALPRRQSCRPVVERTGVRGLLTLLGVLLWTVPLAAQTVAPETPPPQRQPFLLGGIQTHELDHERWMAALHRNGMNAVQVTVYAHQGPWNTAKLWYAEEEPAVLAEIRAARRNGIQVVLILRVALDHNEPANRHLWHGLIYPETEEETREWFRRYTEFAVRWARIAEREGIEVFGIASEMNSLAATLPVEEIPPLADWYLDDESQQRLRDLVERSEHLFSEDIRLSMGAGDFPVLDDFLVERNRAERVWARIYTFAGEERSVEERVAAINRRRHLLDGLWRDLANQVREVYTGRTTLAANFDNYHEVSFWDALDQMGINAYFPLRETLDTPLDPQGLADAWRKILGQVGTFQGEHDLDLPVVFTELGYTRWRGVTVAPWSSQGFVPMWAPDGETANDHAFFWQTQPLEPSERAMALGALHQVWTEDPSLLAGLLYWKLSSDRDLQRFEPFMLYLGDSPDDPSLGELRRFAEGIRPLGLAARKGPENQGLDAVVRDDLPALTQLIPGAEPSPPPSWLTLAVRLGRGGIARHLLSQGAATNTPDPNGFLPLHWSCYQDDPELVDQLLPPQGVPWQDDLGETPLMKCARLDNAAVARRLLAYGDRVEATNQRQESALHLAVTLASPTLVELLSAAGADAARPDAQGMTALHRAARRGEPAVVAILAGGGQGGPNPEGNRPASEAAIFGRRQVFHQLFDARTAGETNVYGQTLLHLAAHGGDVEILRTLLQHFDRVDPVDDDGWTPLAFATRNGRLEVVEALLAQGAEIGHRNKQGTAPLHLAAASREPWLIQRFLQQDLALDLADGDGNTALHHAAGWGRLENLRLLLAAGADPTLRNEAGETPLEIAEDSGRRRAVELLRRELARRELLRRELQGRAVTNLEEERR